MTALCYIPFSYAHICKHGLQYLECEIKDGIAYFPEHEIFPGAKYGFHCKTVGEIKDGKEVYKYQSYLEEYWNKFGHPVI